MAKANKTIRRKASKIASKGARRMFDDVISVAGTLARGRKDYGADKLQSVAQSTRAFAASMTDLPSLKAHATQAADSIESLSQYVIHTDMETILTDAAALARRYPLVTIAATVAAGVAATRYFMPAGGAKTKTAAQKRARRQAAPVARKVVARKAAARKAKPPVKSSSNGRAHADA